LGIITLNYVIVSFLVPGPFTDAFLSTWVWGFTACGERLTGRFTSNYLGGKRMQ